MKAPEGYVWYTDIESGQPTLIRKETYEIMQRMRDKLFKPLLPNKGVIIITSTMADDSASHEEFKNLWNQQDWLK